MSSKQNLPNAPNTNQNYTGEQTYLEQLQFKYPRTIIGNLTPFTSSTSGITYNMVTYDGGTYANQGEEGMMSLLQSVLANYGINATDFNNKMDTSGGTFTGNIAMGRNELQQPKVKDFTEVYNNNASASGSVTLDMSTGNNFVLVLTGSITSMSVTNVAPSGQLSVISLVIKQDSTARTVAYPTSFVFPNATPPDISTVSVTYAMSLYTVDGGTKWGFLGCTQGLVVL